MQIGSERNLRCSFCGKSEHEVTYLVAGGRNAIVYICGACVDKCAEIIGKAKESGSAPNPA